MNKRKKILIPCLATLICLGGAVNVNAESPSSNETQDNYYSEVTYYSGEKLRNIQPYDTESENEVLVSAVEKTVYVSETKDDNGAVIDSHLMNVDEVKEYKNSLLTRDSTYMGEDKTSSGRLTIQIQLFRDGSTYRAYGNANWAIGAGTSAQAPSTGLDFVALTWGGNNNLVQTSKSLSITNFNGQAMSYGQAKADSYSGYCWSFNESVGGKDMRSLQATAQIKRVNSTLKNKQTNMKFTYIHTYQSTTGSISFGAGSSGLAGSVNLSSTASKWQLEVDVPGIVY
ncbi:MAG: hypothetical protein RR623_01590 [Bacilli bacterium]